MSEMTVIKVYGRDQVCASCVGAPGSKDTYEWLQAAIGRKYNDHNINYKYIDMDEEQDDEWDRAFIEQMEEEDLFYPLVMLNEEIIAEGVPQIKKIFKAVETVGIDKLSD